MDIDDTDSEESHDPAGQFEKATELPSSTSASGLAETSKYFAEFIQQARHRADNLSQETSRRSSLALKEIDELSDSAAHVTAFRASGEFRRLKERVCSAEKNVVIERDRYARLLSRFTAMSERQTEDVRRIQCLQRALSEYQEINEMLARLLEQQGGTLERLVMSMRRAREGLSRNNEPGHAGQEASADYDVWSKQQLQSAIREANQVLNDFDDVWGDSSELAEQTFPMAARAKPFDVT